MDSSVTGVGGSSNNGTQNSGYRKRSYTRLSSTQRKILQDFFNECCYPKDAKRRELAAEVGLDPKQVKYWFQNKRLQHKSQCARADSSALRVENERVQKENLIYRDELKKIFCTDCGVPLFPQEKHEHFMQQMSLENSQLKDKWEKVTNCLQSLMGSQVSQQELQQGLIPIIGSSHDPSIASLLNQGAGGSRSSSIGLTSIIGGDSASLHNNPMEESLDFQNQKLLMKGIASTATRELAKLLLYNEPFWVLSSSQEGKLTLHPEIYEIFFPKNKHFIGPNVRAESSKDSVTVNISGMQLVEMFLDPVKWANLFPSILAKAETIKVFDSGLSSNRNGALLLMCGEMHVLSPLVQPRKFHFLRYCEHVKAGLWMITDVSVDPSRQHNPFSRSWKHPSGCMIQEIPDGSCRVFWVEHVEVDEMQTHQLFRDLVDTKIIYGAERWIKELQRMCERFTCFSEDKTQDHDHRGVIHSNEGKRSVMNLACRMVKMFCESLSMTGYEMNFPSSNMENTSGIKFSVRKNTEMGQPSGTVVVATTTLWLPLHYQKVFEFLTDISKRSQWDVLAAEHSVHEIGNILVGANPGNYISLIQPLMSNTENNMVILQECFMDPMRSYIVFAPTDIPAMNAAIGGGDTSMIQILPSGFVISTDGQTNIENSRGSLLTVAFQILVNSLTADELPVLDVGNAGDVLTFLDSIVEKIHSALSSY